MRKRLLLSTFLVCRSLCVGGLLFLCTFSYSQEYGWTDISDKIPGSPDLSDVFFVSDDEGWISTSSFAEIYHTTDGGETFEIQTTQYYCNAIYMISETEGYAGGANGRVYRTKDGGENWIAIGSIGVTLSDIDFATATLGYCCGFDGSVFSITPDGLETLNSGLSSDLNGVSSTSVDNLWICGGANIVFYDGSNFTFQSGLAGTYNAIFFIDDTEGWVVGTSGSIGHTENSGISWENQAPGNPSDESLFDMFFLTSEIGWAVGANGTIIETSNGGENWDIVGSGLTTSLLRGVHFTSPTNGYVVGNEKHLLKYTQLSGTGNIIVETLQFDIFPNPVKDKMHIKCIEFKTENGAIEILSLDGKELLVKEIGKRNEIIETDLRKLKPGMYLCKVSIGNRCSSKKIIKE